MNERYSTGLPTFGNQTDRFCQSGYKEESKTVEQMFADAARVKDLTGLELVGTWNINEKNIDLVNKLRKKYNFEIVSVIVDIFTQARWGKGTFTSKDPKIRRQTIDEVKKYMDIAAELGCDLVDVWFGQDGYDYSFQSNYKRAWEYLIDGLKECVEYRNDIRVGIEYKPKEPRTHCYVSTVCKTLSLISKIAKDNVGVIIDIGHALFANENMGESVALCKLFGDKLFHVHLNDNYRCWDDDMMVGSVHIPEYLELLYWLKKTEYKGWYSFDIYPYRENSVEAITECINWTKSLLKALKSIDEKEIEKIINEEDAVKSLALIRRMLFK